MKNKYFTRESLCVVVFAAVLVVVKNTTRQSQRTGNSLQYVYMARRTEL